MNHRSLISKRRSLTKTASNEETQVPAGPTASSSTASLDGDTRRQLIAVEAYFLAQRRDFAPGCELDDWLAAEAIVEERLRGTNAREPASGGSGRA